MSVAAFEVGSQSSSRRFDAQREHEHWELGALKVELQAALAREAALLREQRVLSQRQALLAEEFEHRLVNGLQVIGSLLTLQSRTATTAEAAAQLTVAAGRVSALGRVHHRLHLLDHQENVKIKPYLNGLSDDLSRLLFPDVSDCAIVFEGVDAEIPTTLAIPLGFIFNELTTNSAKYGSGNITVRFESTSPTHYSLSVLDEGLGLPKGFNPANSKGLGMRIVQALVKQIGGKLHFGRVHNGLGACISVTFALPQPETNGK